MIHSRSWEMEIGRPSVEWYMRPRVTFSTSGRHISMSHSLPCVICQVSSASQQGLLPPMCSPRRCVVYRVYILALVLGCRLQIYLFCTALPRLTLVLVRKTDSTCGVVVSGVRRMNAVNARRARLVPGRVTVFGRVYHLGM